MAMILNDQLSLTPLANIFLDELQRRNELGADAEKLEPLPLYLATLQSQAADEHLARRIQEESTSSDFKIPPRAQPGSRSDPGALTYRLNRDDKN
jgi:hypothetical protein